MVKKPILVFALFVLLQLIACAPEVKTNFVRLNSIRSKDALKSIYLVDDVTIYLPTGYKRKLRLGTRWDFVGQMANGDVYKPYNQVFTVEGAHVHEAYIVVFNGQLVGFYLPVEKAFSPLSSKITLPIK